MSETKKVYLLIEAEVDVAEGFADKEYAKIAVGNLMKIMMMSDSDYSETRGLIFHLKDGDVSYQKPRPILGEYDIVDDQDGVYLLDWH